MDIKPEDFLNLISKAKKNNFKIENSEVEDIYSFIGKYKNSKISERDNIRNIFSSNDRMSFYYFLIF
jgi:hypothetical protein